MDGGVLFVVHVWHDARGFHATARDVTREDADEFDDPVVLVRFLAAARSPPDLRKEEPGAPPAPR